MKLYTLEYDFAGTSMSLQTNSIFELSKKLEEALDKENLTPDSIVVKTTNLVTVNDNFTQRAQAHGLPA